MWFLPSFLWSDYLYICIGFVLLIKGANILVGGASSIAKTLGIPPLVIGLTVVAFGTSAPELFVNILSALNGQTDLALGNIVGSNIANTLLIIGAAAIIYPLQAKSSTIYKEIPFSLLASFVLFFLAFDIGISHLGENQIVRGDALVLLSLFSIFFVYTFGMAKKSDFSKEELEVESHSLKMSILLIIGGLIGLSLWAQLLVESAKNIASAFWVSEAVIGLTLVAIWTSLPELATSIVAAMKKESDIVIGNVVGSNIFNILLVLGTTGVIANLPVSESIISDIVIELASILLLLILIFIGKRGSLGRKEGIIFLFLYILYMLYLAYTQF